MAGSYSIGVLVKQYGKAGWRCCVKRLGIRCSASPIGPRCTGLRHPGLVPGANPPRAISLVETWMPEQARHDGAILSVRLATASGSALPVRHPKIGRAHV